VKNNQSKTQYLVKNGKKNKNEQEIVKKEQEMDTF